SRRVDDIDFADATWERLGFVNELKYNWNVGDLERATRLRGIEAFRHPWQTVFHQWRLTMPWFVVYRFPSEFIGSELCWAGDVLWESEADKFSLDRHGAMECRAIKIDDVGRRVFGVAIAKEAPLAMQLRPTTFVRIRQWVGPLLALIGVAVVIVLLVRAQF